MAVAGTYIIVNTLTNNRYIGIANDIGNRFNTRLATVTEMGFPSIPTMAAIGVTWGHTRVLNALTGPVWPGPAAPWMIAAPNPPNPFVTVLHGLPINLERLLIRYVITQLGAGGTVSNNAMAANAYQNPTLNPISVRVSWGAMGNLFVPGFHDSTWGVGPAAAW
jgi:hypothetical protein